MRSSWDKYFMDIAGMVATRATCPRLHVGAVLVKDKHIISTGYNGVPSNTQHCYEHGCVLSPDNHCTLSIHAEINAIKHCQVDTRCSILYVTNNPCANCTLAAHEAGIKRIVYGSMYKLVDYAKLGLDMNQLPEIVKLLETDL